MPEQQQQSRRRCRTNRRPNSSSSSTFLANAGLLLLVLVLLSLQQCIDALPCPPTGCGPFGSCILDTRSCGNACEESCKCDPGFAGVDCSFQAESCPGPVGPNGERTCFNGGACQIIADDGQDSVEGGNDVDAVFDGDVDEWSCNCLAAQVSTAAQPQIVTGFQCEFASQVSCELGSADSNYAFCTNGGTCLRMVRAGKPHRGCFCGAAHEGRHCQYKAGTAPAQELAYLREQERADEADEGLSGVGTTFIVLVALVAVSGTGYFLYNRHKSSTEHAFQSQAVMENDLQLEELDGSNKHDNGGVNNGGEINVEALEEAEII